MQLTRSFYGHEDLGLITKLLAELPGIFNWSIAGWQRLTARARFMQPKSGVELANELENLSSPMKAFIKERCVVAPEQSIGCKRLYGVWCEWNAQNGQWSLPPGNRIEVWVALVTQQRSGRL